MNARRRASVILVATLLLAAVSSCSFDYGLQDDGGDGDPDLVMCDLEYVRVRDGAPQVRLQAERAESWESENRMRFTALRFAQYDRDGKSDALGRADRADVDSESGDAELQGAVLLVVPSEKLSIETDSLSWRYEDRILSGPPEARTTLERSDGSGMSGAGFTADARSKSWRFGKDVRGSYVEEGDR